MIREYEDDEYDYNDEVEEEKCPVSDEILFKLGQLWVPSRMNLIDRGSPVAYNHLALLGYATRVEDGYQITPEGTALVHKWNRKLRVI